MDLNGVGWFGAIVFGALAGWLAEKIMKSDMGLLMNIVLGIVGAVVLNAILAALDTGLGVGVWRFFIAGVIGGCLLIWVARLVRR